jgi:uncharacterized protein YjbJ (UPF0337 family)
MQEGSSAMDRDRIEGPVKEGVGKVKEEWGEATGQPDTELEGRIDQAAGKVQNTFGEAKDRVRDALDDEEDEADRDPA